MKEKIFALLEDADFSAKLETLSTAEEILAAFKEYGVDITAEELQALAGSIGELDLDALDNVAGGILALPISPSVGITRALAVLINKLKKK